MNYLGVDNGITGGLVLLSSTSEIRASIAMPIQKARKGNEIDVSAVIEWMLNNDIHHANTVVILEEPTGTQSAKSAYSMGGSFHSLRTIFTIGRFRLLRVTPQSWQKKMLNCKAGESKSVALSVARSLWPAMDWRENPRCRVAHDGIVDAALLAEYARRNNL